MELALPDGALKVWRKSTGRYTITALGQAAHSGADHAKGINAIEEMAHQILRLQNMTRLPSKRGSPDGSTADSPVEILPT